MKLIIAEDEEILREVLKEKFERAEFKVLTARDGEEALELIKKSNPDAVLLDLILPKKTGLSVLEEAKKHPGIKTIPIIVLSNLGEDENIKQALSLGAADYLVKTQHPIKEIVEKVKNHVLKKSK